MKIETYLNAMEKAFYASSDTELALSPKHIKFYNKRVRQYHAFRSRILRMDAEKEQMIRDMAWLAYCDQVIDTQSECDLIGPGNEYADMEDWIESYIDGLKQTIEHMQSLEGTND